MLPTEIKVGHVFRYSYLWHWPTGAELELDS